MYPLAKPRLSRFAPPLPGYRRVVLSNKSMKLYHTLYLTCLRGNVMTYMTLSEISRIGTPLSTGQALAANPFAPFVPCHRVIGAKGYIPGYFGKTDQEAIYRRLFVLVSEGIAIKDISGPAADNFKQIWYKLHNKHDDHDNNTNKNDIIDIDIDIDPVDQPKKRQRTKKSIDNDGNIRNNTTIATTTKSKKSNTPQCYILNSEIYMNYKDKDIPYDKDDKKSIIDGQPSHGSLRLLSTFIQLLIGHGYKLISPQTTDVCHGAPYTHDNSWYIWDVPDPQVRYPDGWGLYDQAVDRGFIIPPPLPSPSTSKSKQNDEDNNKSKCDDDNDDDYDNDNDDK